jgi:hypothetical protein
MNPKDSDIIPLRELEATMIALWKKHPEMTDYVAQRAYEGVFQHYRALLRGQPPKACGEKGVDLEAFNVVLAAAESLRTRGVALKTKDSPAGPIALETLVNYLRELSKSVARNTARNGRQGYLSFVRDFV